LKLFSYFYPLLFIFRRHIAKIGKAKAGIIRISEAKTGEAKIGEAKTNNPKTGKAKIDRITHI